MPIWKLDGSKMSVKLLQINFRIFLNSSNSAILVSWHEILSVKLSCCRYFACVLLFPLGRYSSSDMISWENVSLSAELLLHSSHECKDDFQSCPVCPRDLTVLSFLLDFLNAKSTKYKQVLKTMTALENTWGL